MLAPTERHSIQRSRLEYHSITVRWNSIKKHFVFTVELWDEKRSPNYRRALSYGENLWKSLSDWGVIRSQRPNDIDTKLWLMAFVRLWRDSNLEPGLTITHDDWWSIAEWLKFHPESLVEYDDDDETTMDNIHRDIALRIFDAYLTLGEFGRDILAWSEDDAGPYLLIVDTKKYRQDRPIGVSTVRGLLGAVIDEQTRQADVPVKGMLITSSYFSPEAQQFQRRHEYPIALKDYSEVVNWIGVHPFKQWG